MKTTPTNAQTKVNLLEPKKPLTRRTLRHPRRKRQRRGKPSLRFSPTAWAKLLFLRDCGDSEVGGFGITPADDLLLIEDVQLVRQACTVISVEFDDASVADFFDEQIDQRRKPAQFARSWIHTHPGDSPRPSGTDEETFARCFGGCDWSVMFILAAGGQTYARLRFNVGPGGQKRLPVEIDYSRPFPATDQAAWEQEYRKNVKTIPEATVWADELGAELCERGDPFEIPLDQYNDLFFYDERNNDGKLD